MHSAIHPQMFDIILLQKDVEIGMYQKMHISNEKTNTKCKMTDEQFKNLMDSYILCMIELVKLKNSEVTFDQTATIIQDSITKNVGRLTNISYTTTDKEKSDHNQLLDAYKDNSTTVSNYWLRQYLFEIRNVRDVFNKIITRIELYFHPTKTGVTLENVLIDDERANTMRNRVMYLIGNGEAPVVRKQQLQIKSRTKKRDDAEDEYDSDELSTSCSQVNEDTNHVRRTSTKRTSAATNRSRRHANKNRPPSEEDSHDTNTRNVREWMLDSQSLANSHGTKRARENTDDDLCEYELQRLKNIEDRQQVLQKLGLEEARRLLEDIPDKQVSGKKSCRTKPTNEAGDTQNDGDNRELPHTEGRDVGPLSPGLCELFSPQNDDKEQRPIDSENYYGSQASEVGDMSGLRSACASTRTDTRVQLQAAVDIFSQQNPKKRTDSWLNGMTESVTGSQSGRAESERMSDTNQGRSWLGGLFGFAAGTQPNQVESGRMSDTASWLHGVARSIAGSRHGVDRSIAGSRHDRYEFGSIIDRASSIEFSFNP